MSKRAAVAAAALAILCAAPRGARAQGTTSTIEAARTQIENIRPDSAHVLLIRSPAPRGATYEARYWTLLGLTELLRRNEEDALAAFRRALDADLALRIDSLAYLHSDAQRIFAAARSDVRRTLGAASPVGVTVAMDTVLAPWQGRLLIELRPRLRSRVIVSVAPERNAGNVVWADTQDVGAIATFAWDLQSRGEIVPPGRYLLRVTGVDVLRRVSPPTERLLMISRVAVDTLTPPGAEDATLPPPAPRLTRGSPERLLIGAALGIGAASLTSLAGNREINSGFSDRSRFVVAGAISGAAVIGFLTGERRVEAPPPQPERQATEPERVIAEENARRRATAPVRIQTGGGR